MVGFQDILAARERIRDQIYFSPCAYSETISRMTGNRVFFKLDNLQITGSFKERGALNRLLTLPKDQARRGVIAASAGNHGLAVAYHSQRLGISATIVMPVQAPLIKASRVERYGARARFFGADYEEAFTEARRLGKEEGLTLIHGFDDPDVIAGQGTLGIELHEQNPKLEAVVVPVGGGGLIAGIAVALKHLNPKVRVVGVQAERVPAMQASLQKGELIHLGPATTIADGIAIRTVGEIPFRLAQKYVDAVVTVSEGEIANAVLMLLEIEKTVAEGAAAAPLAALLNKKTDLQDKNVGAVVTGGNIDVNLLSRIIEKGLVEDGRLSRLSIILPDRPGSLARLTQCIGKERANILHIAHVRAFGEVAVGETEVDLVLETTGRNHIRQIHKALSEEGFRIKALG